jgi:NDP-sugar pyrophosphorylase family protein
MGIYCLNRSVIESILRGRPYGFDQLMLNGIKNKDKIHVHKFNGFWLDIGRAEDYQYADQHYLDIKKKLRIE